MGAGGRVIGGHGHEGQGGRGRAGQGGTGLVPSERRGKNWKEFWYRF